MSERDEIRMGWRMVGLAWQTTSEVAAGLLLGWLADKWRGSGNLGMAIGGTLGIVVGLVTLIRGAMKMNAELDRKSPWSRPRARPENGQEKGDQ